MSLVLLVLEALVLIVAALHFIYTVRRDRVILSFKNIKLAKTETGLLAIGCRLVNRSDYTLTFNKYHLLADDGTIIAPYPTTQIHIIHSKSDIQFAPQFEMPKTPKVRLVIELTTGQQFSKKLNLKKLLRE